jgi:16S rRNA (cytosine967-C5)-methyltransferase
MTPESVTRLARGQATILAAARAAVRPGGAIVYATCTLAPAENEAVVAGCGLSLDSERLVLPHRDRTDGFYIARLSR